MTIMDSAKWPELSEWDAEIKRSIDARPQMAPDLQVSQIPRMRKLRDAVRKPDILSRLDFCGVVESTVDIPSRDGHSLPAVIYKPFALSEAAGPLAILFHGGAFISGFPEMEAGAAIALVKEHGVTVVCPRYRLAPEHLFPTAINDCWDALQWCASHASKLGADASKGFLVGGSSAGGNIAACLQHLARDENLRPPVTAAWLAYPGTVDPDVIPEKYKHECTSFKQNAEVPSFNKNVYDFMKRAYQPDPSSELWSPLLWASGHAGLARTYVQVCGLDPMRDDGLLYERELRRQGVETRVDAYAGCPHGHDVMWPETAKARQFREDRSRNFKWLLGKEE
ncbi:AB hydrolase superfamily [Lecanosticta acicola]|uniref:AB hydrolase superfamily n=1 Tax=Lecanosticta acicola TaxID=111012 RepID=A0AAI8YV69_9PEZI|nr:AB hydrolase superfamily [Lecanosticta acicola]